MARVRTTYYSIVCRRELIIRVWRFAEVNLWTPLLRIDYVRYKLVEIEKMARFAKPNLVTRSSATFGSLKKNREFFSVPSCGVAFAQIYMYLFPPTLKSLLTFATRIRLDQSLTVARI